MDDATKSESQHFTAKRHTHTYVQAHTYKNMKMAQRQTGQQNGQQMDKVDDGRAQTHIERE